MAKTPFSKRHRVFLVLAHDRRRIVHFGVTDHPTAEWTAQQLREAFPWDRAPRFLLRDRDRIFGADFTRQVKEFGIHEVPYAGAYAYGKTEHSVRYENGEPSTEAWLPYGKSAACTTGTSGRQPKLWRGRSRPRASAPRLASLDNRGRERLGFDFSSGRGRSDC